MGRWHVDKFLKPCLDGKVNVRSAFFSKSERKGQPEYFMHVTFEYKVAQVETETFLGVDRGIVNLIALTVTDKKGNIIDQELHSGDEMKAYQYHEFVQRRRLQRRGKDITGRAYVRGRNEEICYSLANVIVDMAAKYKSQVVMEWLGGFKERKKGFGMLKRTPLQRIEQIVDYKLPLAGLPKIKTVPAAYTSQECPKCEHRERKNRVSQSEFRCVRCSYETHADKNGSHNVARRRIDQLARRGKSTLTAA
jgi:transposase